MEIQEEITKVLKDFPSEKYPNYIGVSLSKDEKTIVGILYENEDHKRLNTVNDEVYPQLDPVEHVYRVLAMGAELFHISDEIHKACWHETQKSMQDIDDYCDNYHHGKRRYFAYCHNHSIDSEYMKAISDEEIASADESFQKLDKRMIQKAEIELEKCPQMEVITKICYEYLLCEPYYREIEPAFTLSKQDGSDSISYFYYEFDNFVSITADEYPKIIDFQNWAFHYEEQLFEALQNGNQIKFMTLDTHANIALELNEGIGQDYFDEYKKGIHHYLTYAKKHHIEKYVDETFQPVFKRVYEHYGMINKQKKQSKER